MIIVEVLQQAMDAQGIAFAAQNRLLAQLAPMHRDIVNVKWCLPHPSFFCRPLRRP